MNKHLIPPGVAVNNDIARFNMIEQQIRPWEVLDGQVLSLLSVVKRENFAPMAHKALAFADMEIPLQKDGGSGQVMLAPRVEARFLQNAAVKHTDKVLEIGTGSGYMAALLASQAASVLSFELDAALAQQARANLQTAGIHNAEVRHADGCQGAPIDGPFDVIVLSGSVAEVPQVLLSQLKVGGRLLAVVGEDPMMRATVITRTADQQWQTTEPWDTTAPRLLGFPEHQRFSF
jgi:protein-L-isoaspartate(D-aspartate) O-methyltransferase